jgi:predicted acetyltransferase
MIDPDPASAPPPPSARLRLRPLTADDETQARRAHAELAADDFTFLLDDFTPDEPWAGYLARLEAHRRGRDLPPDQVAATFLVADVAGVMVGRVSIRHELNDYLRRVGGHIGYGIRPGHRRRGHATAALREALLVAGRLGIERALVTCDDGNVGSTTVIERCGGVLEDVVPDGDDAPKRRYWIEAPRL